MIAGFLMLGNVAATPFSTWSFLGTKYGMMAGQIFMIIGWLVLWQARNFYWLLASRFLIGIGNGFGLGQLKTYINEMCFKPGLALTFQKLINVYILFGIVLVCGFGPFVHFRTLSVLGSLCCSACAVLTLFLPHSPAEYLRMDQETKTRDLLRTLTPYDEEGEFLRTKNCVETVETHLTLGQILRKKHSRKNFVLLTCLIYFQQFSGAPATIVYGQIIFKALRTDRPEICALIYAIALLASTAFTTFVLLDNFNKKTLLLVSTIAVSIILAVNIYVIYFRYNESSWNYISFVLMLLYIFFHSIGLGAVPFAFLDSRFKKESKRTVSHYSWMLFSILALIITKIFQVLYERYEFYVPFCLFLCSSVLSVVFALTLYPSKDKVDKSPISRC